MTAPHETTDGGFHRLHLAVYVLFCLAFCGVPYVTLLADEPGFAVVGLLALTFPAALALEPSTDQPAWRVGLAAGLAALLPAVVVACSSVTPYPGWPKSDRSLYGDLLFSPGFMPGVITLVLALAVCAPLLFTRRWNRKLEWQVAAGSLGGLFAVAPLLPFADAGAGRILVALLGCALGLVVGSATYRVDSKDGEALADTGTTKVVPPVLLVGLLLVYPIGWLVHTQVTALVEPEYVADTEVEEALVACVEAQERYRKEKGRYAPCLAELDGVDDDLGRTRKGEYLIRYATSEGGQVWMIAADPIDPGHRPFLTIGSKDPTLQRSLTPASVYPKAEGTKPGH